MGENGESQEDPAGHSALTDLPGFHGLTMIFILVRFARFVVYPQSDRSVRANPMSGTHC
jgi:hypothetical protein